MRHLQFEYAKLQDVHNLCFLVYVPYVCRPTATRVDYTTKKLVVKGLLVYTMNDSSVVNNVKDVNGLKDVKDRNVVKTQNMVRHGEGQTHIFY